MCCKATAGVPIILQEPVLTRIYVVVLVVVEDVQKRQSTTRTIVLVPLEKQNLFLVVHHIHMMLMNDKFFELQALI